MWYVENNVVSPLSSFQREIVDRFLQQPDNSYSIIIDNIRKVYPPKDGNAEKVAVKGVSFAIQRGQCFGLLGSNDAGKTSLISMVCKSYFVMWISWPFFSPWEVGCYYYVCSLQ